MDDRPQSTPPTDATTGPSTGGEGPQGPDPAEPEPGSPGRPTVEEAPGDDAGGPPPLDPPPERPPPETSSWPWGLRRSVTDRKVKGVAGGLAAAADIDPTLVRLLFALAGLSGFGLVAYIVLALVLRDETADDRVRPLPRDQRRVLRIVLAVAAAAAVGRLFDGWFLGIGDGDGDLGLPLVLIAVGAFVLWARRDVQPQASGGGWPEGSPGPTGGQGWTDPDGEGRPPPPPWPVTPVPAPVGGGVGWRSTGRDLLRLGAAFAAVGAFLALLVGTFLVVVGAVPMRLPFLPAAIGLGALVALVVAVSRGSRPASLLVPGGALVVAVALAAGLASFPGGAGERTITVGPNTPLSDRYEHGAGHLVLDLARLSIPAGVERRVVAEVGIGQLSVIVPREATVDVRARVGAGGTNLFGPQQGPGSLDVTALNPGIGESGRLRLDLKAGVGQIQVVLADEPTFPVSCRVPEDPVATPGGPVSCPHPSPLESTAMTCSVVLADPDGDAEGQGFCRRLGAETPPVAGTFASACTVPAESEAADCRGLDPAQVERLGRLRSAAPTTAAPVAGGPGALTCGPPDPTGVLTCTQAPASSSTTTTSATFRCSEAPATGQLTCVPA
ncbi:MAG: hypothetical protein AVDCRST_MAG76-2197 [uncultured Acidimicrobiales bacterium]|uniref:Phage shock protein PspC N-terminal domain-containing protein n=1 Tax=uncultured Acidimicrobiales bacterium TaxID=310071 RepID=A0A6J4IGB3_9ACTN|nr:MAG: hypothetical protein AVDCRST_MAG76-2197 [uncultured Acidimicrobiales bacterium]